MKTLFRHLLFVPLLLAAISTAAQKNVVSVNEFTGTPSISIPMFNVQSGSLSLPVSVVHSGTGVKVKSIEGNAGMNWQLVAGGSISREVRGLPDDCSKNQNNLPRKGWLYNTNGTAISSLAFHNDNFATCQDTTDAHYLSSHFTDLSDTEPDAFYVSAPGLSLQFVFDSNHAIRTIPYRDIKISYTTNADSSINTFTVLNDKGIKYTFADSEPTVTYTEASNPSTISFFKTAFLQYQKTIAIPLPKGIAYTATWHLTSMSDPNGNSIDLEYDCRCDPGDTFDDRYIYSVDSLNLAVGAPSGAHTNSYQYKTVTRVEPHFLSTIGYSNSHGYRTVLSLTYVLSRANTRMVKTITGFGKVITFNYAVTAYKTFLRSFTSSTGGCIDPNSYTFDYDGLNYGGTPSIPIPDSASRKIDYWGYYNGSSATALIPQMYVNPSNGSYERYRPNIATNNTSVYPYLLSGAARDASATNVKLGTLTKITYAEGGSTTLEYESNDYYDPTAGAVVTGGGVRIKTITDYDGMDAAKNIVQSYSYVDPVAGRSSGKPTGFPVFAFTVPYSGGGTTADQWNYSTVRSEDNLSEEDNTIVYTYVKRSMSGAGSTAYEFSAPATNWDASASPDWAPTVNYIARPTCGTAVGFMTRDKNTYPFAPNTNFDFERGLLNKVTSYNGSGNKVSESSYTYTRSGSPVVITGLRFEMNGALTAYSKYSIFAQTSELTTQVVAKVYDSQTTPTLSQQTTTNTYYGSSAHKYPTQVQVTNSDGSVQNSYVKYIKDYTISSAGTDSAANGIFRLQKLNINVPVESYSQLVRSGTTTTLGGQLSKFRTVNPTGSAYMYLPYQSLAFTGIDSAHADGISGFTPSTISSGTFSNDSHYIVTGNSLAYDFGGALLSADDNYHRVSTAITDHTSGAAVASISNAKYDEIGYNDFNSDIAPVSFTMGSYSYSGNARSGQYALSLPASTAMSRTVNKNALAKNYVFSVWINSTTSGSITVTVAGTPYTLSYANTAGAWQYYERKVPVTALSSSFTAQFQSSQAILIDDVWFYPDVSEVSSVAYDPTTFQRTSQTNTNGVSAYYGYDTFNRLKFVYDQDRNIVEKKSYYLASNTYPLSSISIGSSPGTVYVGTSVNFTLANILECVPDQFSASWDFGDGSSVVTGIAPIHSYSSIGSFTVTVTITSPFFNTTVVTSTVTVTSSAIPVVYTNNVSNVNRGKVTSLKLYAASNHSTLLYNFSESDLISGQNILQGDYYIEFTVSSPGGSPLWNSLNFNNGSSDVGCWNRSSGTSGTMTLYLSAASALNVTVNTGTCLF